MRFPQDGQEHQHTSLETIIYIIFDVVYIIVILHEVKELQLPLNCP